MIISGKTKFRNQIKIESKSPWGLFHISVVQNLKKY